MEGSGKASHRNHQGYLCTTPCSVSRVSSYLVDNSCAYSNNCANFCKYCLPVALLLVQSHIQSYYLPKSTCLLRAATLQTEIMFSISVLCVQINIVFRGKRLGEVLF